MANDNVIVSIVQWSIDDINAQNLKVDLSLTSKGVAFKASADSVQLAPPIGKLSKVKLNCKELLIVSESFSCARGQIAFSQNELGSQQLEFEIEAQPASESYKVEVEHINLASAQFAATFIVKQDTWKVFADTPQVQLSSLITLLTPYFQAEQLAVLAQWSIAGQLRLDIDLFGHANQLNAFKLDLVSQSLNLSDTEGLYVSEELGTTLNLEATRSAQDWQWHVDLHSAAGQAYIDPVFMDLTATPITVKAQGQWLQDQAELNIEQATLTQDTITEVELSGSASLSHINNVIVDIKKSDIADLYTSWIQPFVVGLAIDDLQLAGTVDFHYEKQAANYHLSLDLDDVFIDDQANRFGIDGLSGMVTWSNYERAQDLDLHWQSAYLYEIPLGQSAIKAQTNNSSLVSQQAWLLPILDGALQLDNFSLHNPGDQQLRWTFSGELSPISMESLSTALNWPLMHGKLSGVIPSVSYAEQEVKVDGALRVKLFESETTIRDLRLTKPFGTLPQLHANIDMKGLNLETLTQTYDFGKISGRLDGKIYNLRLSNWQAVNFDAKFATPEGDKSRRRISQQAVDNLAQIGGGASGVVQRSFLRFFEDFSYQRLGLSCKLRNEVCDMSGVGEAKQGYYIVKGGGLPPRINVVGYTRRVDWPDLIDRLIAVSESSGPVIK